MNVSKYIDKLIAQGEHQQLDFKYAVSDSKKIARTLAAFANTDGGILLIGVKDNGKVVGVNGDEEYYMVESAAQLYCKPPVLFEVQPWTVNGKTVLEVKVEKSNKRPHLAPDKDGKYSAYIRVADENFVANPILVKAWKKMGHHKSKAFAYTEKYNAMLNLLGENEQLSLLQLCKQLFISERETEDMLVELIVAGLVKVITTEKETFFKIVI